MVAEAVGFMMSRPADGGTMPPELVTRDFLGGCQAPAAAAADPRHDAAAMPGKPPLQKHLSPPPSARGDLNLFPVSGAAAMPPAATMAPAADCAATTTTYHSVCTIEKVKTALERFERGKQGQQQQHHHHHQHSGAGASPSSSSVTTSSVKRRGDVEQGDGCDSPSASATGGMVAAACPRCFLYVLIARSDPRCPRCESHVPPPPAPAPKKKPRIDLNVGFLGT